MKPNIPEFTLHRPTDMQDALRLLSQSTPTWTPFAGGTDLMVQLQAGQLKTRFFLDLQELPELKGIEETPDLIILGAMTRFTEMRQSTALQTYFPNLCHAAAETGAIGIQNRATLGGNIGNASPAADSPPALLSYDAELEVISGHGARWISYSSFHLGYKRTALNPGEIISRVRLPKDPSLSHHYFRKVGTRKAQAISKVCLSGVMHYRMGVVENIRIALGSVAPTPMRCLKAEDLLRGKPLTTEWIQRAAKQVASEIHPISDIRSTSEYRVRVAQNLTEEFLSQVASNVGLDQQA